MRAIFRCFIVLSLVLTSCNFLSAQATATGNIAGVVTDATGAALPNATVTATSKATNAQRTVSSNSAGQYRFDFLPAGVYDVCLGPASNSNGAPIATTPNPAIANVGVNSTGVAESG